MSQGAFHRLDLRPCDRRRPSAVPVTFAPLTSHPFARHVQPGLVKRTPAADSGYLPSPRFASRLPSGAGARCSSPISATDTRHVYPRTLDFRARGFHRPDRRMLPRPRSSSPVRRQTALRRSNPGWDALDGAAPASTDSLTALFSFGEDEARAPPLGQRRLGAAFSTTREAGDRPLTLPVASRGNPETRAPSRSQNRFRRPPIKGDDFPDPERLSSADCSHGARSRSAPHVCGSPPPVSRLGRRRSGFRRFFALPTLARGRARPIVVIHGLFARG
jgi:hypothetical protein